MPVRSSAAALVAVVLPVLVALAPAPAQATDRLDPLSDTNSVVVDGSQPPAVKAKSWVVVNATTGDVLAGKNAHRRLRPASTLKCLTAITLLPQLDLEESYEQSCVILNIP